MERTVADLLREFHTRPGVDCVQPDHPTVDVPGALARTDFIAEELDELREAIEAGDVVKVADALADITYAVYGTAWRCGIDLDPVVAEVHRSNMTKTPAPGDGKAVKGPGYSPPDIAGVLARQYPRVEPASPARVGDVIGPNATDIAPEVLEVRDSQGDVWARAYGDDRYAREDLTDEVDRSQEYDWIITGGGGWSTTPGVLTHTPLTVTKVGNPGEGVPPPPARMWQHPTGAYVLDVD